ncbi:DUF3592 domain-containing protein [Pengzhenrongella sp.]|uniref:DUF3592 domain-containing protein n=1 Tax=Pengzhenrongella sp. TaxID=2888820 RepID=UPI002F938ACA
MNARIPTLRLAILAVGTVLAGFALTAAALGWSAHQYTSAREAASATAQGTVIADDLADGNGGPDIKVRWSDAFGRIHVQGFGIYDTDRYRTGHSFPVAYDPARPGAMGFPGDPRETVGSDDVLMPVSFAAVGAALYLLGWALRGAMFQWATRLPARPMLAMALHGEPLSANPVNLGGSTWLALAEPGTEGTQDRWQRVMWHPGIEGLRGSIDVLVHGDPRSRERLVVELADGARLVPISRVRHRFPKKIRLSERSEVRSNLGAAVILPAGTPPVPRPPWWRRALVLAGIGAVCGAAFGLLVNGGAGSLAIVPFAAMGAVLLVNGWALTGGEP